jgi:repressor LexA
MSETIQPPATDRQREILAFVRERTEVVTCGPTVREIMQHFGFRSPNGAMCHIRALEKKGLLRRRARQTRGIEVVS